MDNSKAKEVILKLYSKLNNDCNYQITNTAEFYSALACAIKALELHIPKKPLYENKYDDCVVYSCPACKDEKLILDGDNYCTACGQALDWSDKS